MVENICVHEKTKISAFACEGADPCWGRGPGTRPSDLVVQGIWSFLTPLTPKLQPTFVQESEPHKFVFSSAMVRLCGTSCPGSKLVRWFQDAAKILVDHMQAPPTYSDVSCAFRDGPCSIFLNLNTTLSSDFQAGLFVTKVTRWVNFCHRASQIQIFQSDTKTCSSCSSLRAPDTHRFRLFTNQAPRGSDERAKFLQLPFCVTAKSCGFNDTTQAEQFGELHEVQIQHVRRTPRSRKKSVVMTLE